MRTLPKQYITNCVECPFYSTKDYEDPYCGNDENKRCFSEEEKERFDLPGDVVPLWCTLEEQ